RTVCPVPGDEPQPTLHHAQLRFPLRGGSAPKAALDRGCFYQQSALDGIAQKARDRSRLALRKESPAHLLQYHRLWIHWPESRKARLRHPCPKCTQQWEFSQRSSRGRKPAVANSSTWLFSIRN